MTKFFKLIAVVFSFIVVSNSALASGFSPWSKVTQINHGELFTYVWAGTANPDGCSRASPYIISNSITDFKSIYATVLTAKAADSNVRFFLQGCQDNGTGTTFPRMYSIINN